MVFRCVCLKTIDCFNEDHCEWVVDCSRHEQRQHQKHDRQQCNIWSSARLVLTGWWTTLESGTQDLNLEWTLIPSHFSLFSLLSPSSSLSSFPLYTNYLGAIRAICYKLPAEQHKTCPQEIYFGAISGTNVPFCNDSFDWLLSQLIMKITLMPSWVSGSRNLMDEKLPKFCNHSLRAAISPTVPLWYDTDNIVQYLFLVKKKN